MKATPSLSSLDELQYLITPPHPCSYLPEKQSRMVFLDPTQRIDTITLSDLSRTGFRRSGDFIYRPECHSCRQCLSSRVLVHEFQPNSQQRKTLKRNQDLHLNIIPSDQAQSYHYHLYNKYIRLRHADGDMYPPSYQQFEKFLIHSCTNSFFMELWQAQKLICVAVCDQLDDGLSAVYTFFDPMMNQRSLGGYAILQQIQYVRQLNLNYLYLGYWVPHAKKMKYKIQYAPLELLMNGCWHKIEKPLEEDECQRLGDSLITLLPHRFK